MTPKKVFFSGLAIDPADLISRVHYGVIPQEWHRHRFYSDAVIYHINQWLTENIEGRWAILASFRNGMREITIAFEHAYDGSLFVLGDGARQCSSLD
jgi:hypothetical protein